MLAYVLERQNTIQAYHTMVEVYHGTKDRIDREVASLNQELHKTKTRKSGAESELSSLEAKLDQTRKSGAEDLEAELVKNRELALSSLEAELEAERGIQSAEIEKLAGRKSDLEREVERLKTEVESAGKTNLSDREVRQVMVSYLWQNQGRTGIDSKAALARFLDVSTKTVTADLNDLGLK
jgi:hypothetical protein